MDNDALHRGLEELAEYIKSSAAQACDALELRHGELMAWTDAERLVAFMTFLRDDPNTLFKQLVDVTAVDYPDEPARFHVIYNLLSLRHNLRLRVKVATDEETPVPSVAGVWNSANWLEREIWDLYGVFFSGHPDLRRILTDYGFEGHPLRKDFPLTGYVEVRYDEEQKRVVYEPVKLMQGFRRFDFESPWEGMMHLPGDEKATVPSGEKQG